MKHIVVYGLTSIVGGVETYILNLYSCFKSEYKFTFILQKELSGFYADYFKNEDCTFFVVGNLKRNPISTLKNLKSIYRENKFDFAYLNMSNSSLFLYTTYLKRFNPSCKIISHSHNGDDKKKLQHFIIRNYLIKKTDIFVTCSKVAGDWMFSKKVMKTKEVIQVNNAIDSNKFKFSPTYRDEIRKQFNISSDQIVIGHIGRFEPQKNHQFILDIAQEFQNYNNVIFILVGTGSLFLKVKNFIENAKMSNVILPGVVADSYKYYSAFDCFILPSLYEGLPIVGIEAQTNGLKCYFANTITDQVSISTDSVFLPLDKNDWVKNISEFINSNPNILDRNYGVINCKKAGFDINTEIMKIKGILK